MTGSKDIEGEGFEILGHEQTKPENADDVKRADAEAEEKAVEEPGEPDREAEPIDVRAVLRVCIVQLSETAWQMMGLHADPLTGKIHTEFEQARIAIDAAAALIDQLLPHLQGQEARDYRNHLADLRLNFVRQSGGAESG